MTDNLRRKETEQIFTHPQNFSEGFFTYEGNLYVWDAWELAWIWLPELQYWVVGGDWLWAETVTRWHHKELKLAEVEKEFPGALPVRYLSTKRRHNKKTKRWLQHLETNTHVPNFEEQLGLPIGYEVTAKLNWEPLQQGKAYRYSHANFPAEHSQAHIWYYTINRVGSTPHYMAVVYPTKSYLESNRSISPYGVIENFEDQKEAQAFVISWLNKIEAELHNPTPSNNNQEEKHD